MQVQLSGGQLCADRPVWKGLPCSQDCRTGTPTTVVQSLGADALYATGQKSLLGSFVFQFITEEIFIVDIVPEISEWKTL